MTPRVSAIVRTLARMYPHPKPFLHSCTPYQHLVATILSAQCTDTRVNMTTPALFKVAPTPQKMVALGEGKLQRMIKSCGFFRVKAKNILSMSRDLVKKYDGKVPESLEEMTKLAGVGRKTASVVLVQVFRKPAFPVDTHVFRVANRLGLAHAKTPEKTEIQLRAATPPQAWHDLHLQLVSHGRVLCKAPRPLCFKCDLRPYCEAYAREFKKTYAPDGKWAKRCRHSSE